MKVRREPGDRVVALNANGRHRLSIAELHVEAHGVARAAYSISTRHGAALSGRELMMVRENTVPAPTLSWRGGVRGSVVSERDIERLQITHCGRLTRSERACPLVPTIAPPI